MWEIDLPPGIMRNGTDLQSEGRWRDGNLIRWRDGAMQPVGGWQQRNGNLGGIARASLAWSSNLGDRLMAFGTHDALKISTPNGAISDISPADLTPGNIKALDLVGFGMGPYGAGEYGMPRPEASISRPATTWSLDTWGENLIAVSTADQRILEWDLLGLAEPVTNAPPCIAAVVSDERFVFALGADGDPRLVRWSDRENNTLWTPETTNEAGDYLLQTQGRIVTGIRAPGQVIILTDIDAHAAQYIGPDLADTTGDQHTVLIRSDFEFLRSRYGNFPIVVNEIGWQDTGRADVANMITSHAKLDSSSGDALSLPLCRYVPRPAGSTFLADTLHYDQATCRVRGGLAATALLELNYGGSKP